MPRRRVLSAAERLSVETLKTMNRQQARKVPEDAPISFVRKRWEHLVATADGYDRRFYELCVLAELKNILRSGDIWVQGSRQFKGFDAYLLSPPRFAAQRAQHDLGLAIETDCDRYLDARLAIMERELATVERLAVQQALPDATIAAGALKITPLENAVPEEADTLIRQAYALLPHLKITESLLEVDSWTGFTRHFTHLKSDEAARDTAALLTAILADAINRPALLAAGVAYPR